jgi:hypothetical protein
MGRKGTWQETATIIQIEGDDNLEKINSWDK